ncbi:hypothetical protein NC651_035537 [Populus alba x Populus x berolinensis]|nr:hypothetical protein NC651_035537 [Populus alba x Populus x berolinensis]
MIRVDFRSSHVHYLNNLEEDAMYKRWRNNINEILMPVFPGQQRYIRKNLFHAVYVLDPATSCGLEASFNSDSVDMILSLYENNFPMRFGLIVYSSKFIKKATSHGLHLSAEENDGETEEDISSLIICLFIYIKESYGTPTAFQFLSNVRLALYFGILSIFLALLWTVTSCNRNMPSAHMVTKYQNSPEYVEVLVFLMSVKVNRLRMESDSADDVPETHQVDGAFMDTILPKVKTPPQDILLKLAKEQTYKELSQESSMFVFKLGLNKLQCCLLMNGLVFDSSEEVLMNAMNDELPRIQEQVYYGQINSHTDVLDKFLSESGISRYNPQDLILCFTLASKVLSCSEIGSQGGYSYSIMISSFCRGGLFEEAKELAGEFEAKYDKYDVAISNAILCAYCRAGKMESVMRTMRKMDELAISPDYNTFHILIKYFCKEKLYMLAYQTMEDMHRKGHQPAENYKAESYLLGQQYENQSTAAVDEDSFGIVSRKRFMLNGNNKALMTKTIATLKLLTSILVQELCSSLVFHLGKIKAHSEAFSVYSVLKYSKRTMCKAFHEKILHILIAGKLLKDAYVVVKDNAKFISSAAIKKFAKSFVKLGNINLINDVLKVIHGSGYKIDQGKLAVLFITSNSYYYAELMMHVRLWGIYDTDECILGIVNASWLFNMIKIPSHLSKLLSIPLDDVESGKEGFSIAAKKLGFLKFYSNEIKALIPSAVEQDGENSRRWPCHVTLLNLKKRTCFYNCYNGCEAKQRIAEILSKKHMMSKALKSHWMTKG